MFVAEIALLLRFSMGEVEKAKENETESELTQSLKDLGLIELAVGGKYTSSDRGDHYLSMLCSVKLPQQKWCNEYGDRIKF